jgi:hypothetical protein
MIGVMLPASTAGGVVNLGNILAVRVPVNLNFTIFVEDLPVGV